MQRPPGESAIPTVCIAMDVNSLGATEAFYAEALGFTRTAAFRVGQIFEEVRLVSPRVPGVMLILRQAFGKRSVGSQPGTLLRLAFRVDDLAREIVRLDPLKRWQGASPVQVPVPPYVRLVDPDGYIIEIFEQEPSVGF
ncbi:hypothetical protein BH11PLA1_BH11PLA1_09450 [soil metagenome]